MSELGKLIDSSAKRDAVHVAIAPARCASVGGLSPGQRVFVSGGQYAYAAVADNAIGVVDPFLTDAVKMHEWFNVCMLPGTITGLRHDWSHPDFADDEDDDYDDGCRGC